jgi:hypothetical protein
LDDNPRSNGHAMVFSPKHVLSTYVVVAIALAFSCTTEAASCKDLPDAVFASDLALVRKLIESQKCSVNTVRPSDKYTLLHIALERVGASGFSHPYYPKEASMIKYLATRGANVKAPFPQYAGITGYTPLHWAAFDGNMVLVPLFVKYGANVNARDQRGFTPLHSAARCDFRLSCDDCTPKPLPKTKLDDSRLWKLGARPVMKYLVSKGGNILAKTNEKASVLNIISTPCGGTPPNTECKQFGARKCPDMCTNAWRNKLNWPTGTCQLTYFYVKDTIASKTNG